jgi:hypothetical protein
LAPTIKQTVITIRLVSPLPPPHRPTTHPNDLSGLKPLQLSANCPHYHFLHLHDPIYLKPRIFAHNSLLGLIPSVIRPDNSRTNTTGQLTYYELPQVKSTPKDDERGSLVAS